MASQARPAQNKPGHLSRSAIWTNGSHVTHDRRQKSAFLESAANLQLQVIGAVATRLGWTEPLRAQFVKTSTCGPLQIGTDQGGCRSTLRQASDW